METSEQFSGAWQVLVCDLLGGVGEGMVMQIWTDAGMGESERERVKQAGRERQAARAGQQKGEHLLSNLKTPCIDDFPGYSRL